MMNKIIIIVVLFFSLTMVSCKKWLDVSSKTVVTETDMFSDEQGFMDAMAGVYYLMTRNSLYGDKLSMGFMNVLGGQYEMTGQFGINNSYYNTNYGTSSYYYTTSIRTIIDSLWLNEYNVIANVNNLLLNIDEKKNVFTDTNNYLLIKGEALGIRAFIHFDLFRMFAPSMQADSNEAAIPYVTQFSGKTVTPLYTGGQIMDSIIRDLKAAETLLKDDNINGSSVLYYWLNDREQHFNNLAVDATLARVYLCRGDKENALVYANKVIDANLLSFDTEADLEQTSTASTPDFSYGKEQIFALAKYDIDDLVDKYFTVNSSSLLTLGTTTSTSSTVSPLNLLYETNTIGGTDYRYVYSWAQRGSTSYYFTRKYEQASAEFPDRIPIIRLPEMYYIAAECLGPVEGVAYLNKVLVARALAELPTTLSDDAFQTEILKEYRKEFYAEGQLFYYYKRKNSTYILDADQVTNINANDVGYVLPMPETEKEFLGR